MTMAGKNCTATAAVPGSSGVGTGNLLALTLKEGEEEGEKKGKGVRLVLEGY